LSFDSKGLVFFCIQVNAVVALMAVLHVTRWRHTVNRRCSTVTSNCK